MKYVTSTFRLPEETYERIRVEAFNRRVSIAEILRDACDIYFETQECPENHELKVQGN
jgi:predicted DNA-binding protein